jgi:DNA-binding MarR family transcriptional regulator
MTNSSHAPVIAAELRVLLGRLRRKLRQEAAHGDFSWSQITVLARIDRDGPATVTELARAEGVRSQSMGATIAGLMADGWLSGTADPADGRQTILSLTDPAREQIKLWRAAREDWLSRAIDRHLAPHEQQTLGDAVELLKRIVDS